MFEINHKFPMFISFTGHQQQTPRRTERIIIMMRFASHTKMRPSEVQLRIINNKTLNFAASNLECKKGPVGYKYFWRGHEEWHTVVIGLLWPCQMRWTRLSSKFVLVSSSTPSNKTATVMCHRLSNRQINSVSLFEDDNCTWRFKGIFPPVNDPLFGIGYFF